jgi:hypothetical protein
VYVYEVIKSNIREWILGKHQGTVSRKHYGYYLDEFIFWFRVNRKDLNFTWETVLPVVGECGMHQIDYL